MKKIFTLLLLFPLFAIAQEIDIKNFKVTEEIGTTFGWGSKFHFEFDIRGDYTYSTNGEYQINLIVYRNTIKPENKVGYSFWNRENDYDIYYSNYTTKSWWFQSLIDFTINSGDKFYLVVEYAGLSKTFTYICEPPIKITQISLPQTYTNNLPTFYYNQSYNYKIWYENIGDNTETIKRVYYFFQKDLVTDNSTLNYYFQNGNLLPDKLYYYIPFNSSKTIAPGAIYSESSYISLSTFTIPSAGKYYLYTVVYYDPYNYDYRVDEVYVKSNTKSAIIAGVNSTSIDNLQINKCNVYPNPSNGTFNVLFGDKNYTKLKVTDITGQQIFTENIEGKTETSVNLPNPISGLYFIEISNKTDREHVKVAVQ